MGFINDVLGRNDRKDARRAAANAQFSPFRLFGAGGSSVQFGTVAPQQQFGYNPGPIMGGGGSTNPWGGGAFWGGAKPERSLPQYGGDAGPFGSFVGGTGALQDALGQAFGVATGSGGGMGFTPEAIPGQDIMLDPGNLGPLRQGLVGGSELFGLGALSQLGLATQDPSQLAAERLGLLRQEAQPFENRAFNRLQDSLFASGRIGTTGGGIQTEAFARGLGQADLARQRQAFDFGRSLQDDATRRASSLNQIGLSQLGGATGIDQLGLQQFQAALNAAIARSNASAGAASNLAALGSNPIVSGADIANFASGFIPG